MQLAKKGICVFLNIFKKRAYALFSQPKRWALQNNTTKSYHFALVRRAIVIKSKNQKCRTGQGKKGTL